jgi:adenylate cyclase
MAGFGNKQDSPVLALGGLRMAKTGHPQPHSATWILPPVAASLLLRRRKRLERRLAAILAADVVGYTRLMGADEAGTLERLKSLRRELVQPKITARKGRIVKLMGDGLLAEFPSVVEAVLCAVAIQGSITEREADLPDEGRIRLRIGVNLGDIIVEGSDIYGDGVNVAARLEGLANPGGICVSGTVFDHVNGKVALDFADLGEQRVKNIDQPVQVYRVALDSEAEASAAAGASPASAALPELPELPDTPSIAVLAFDNMSGDPEQDYFSDGITEDIITELSRFKDLSVVSRNSSFAFKGKAVSLRDVGEKLKVDYVVEGSIRKAGNKVRVTAQLINARSDNHIWAERYDRDLEDIFEVQDDVVRRVAGTLVGRLEHERQERTRRQSESQLKAYDLYLRGRELFFNWTLEDNSKARDFLKAALKIEPDYAAALALSAEVLLRMWLNGWSENPEQDRRESFKAAKRAAEIDDQDSRVHTALGLVYLWQRNPDRAKHHFETALRLNPNDTRALIYYSRQAVFDGDIEKAVELCHRALSLNPYGKYSYNFGIAYFVARQYEQAIDHIHNIGNPPAQVLALLSASYAMAGDEAKAAESYARFRETAKACPVILALSRPEDWQAYFSERWPFRKPEDLEHLIEGLGKAGFPV